MDRKRTAAAAVWRTRLAKVGTLRLAVTLLVLALALCLARYSWLPKPTEAAERALYDVRTTIASPRVAQDDRIVLVVFTEDTLAATGKRSPLDRAFLAKALTNLDALKPRSIGIDILLDQPQPEDAKLLPALRAMRTPTYIAFANATDNGADIKPWQEAHLRRFFTSFAGTSVHPASIRLNVDTDGSFRSWPTPPNAPPPLLTTLTTTAQATTGRTGAVAFRRARVIDRPVFSSFPIDLFADPASAAMLAPQIAGRIVLIGADLPDADRFPTPATRLSGETTAGVELHATLIAQALDGVRMKPLPAWALWLAALLAIVGATVIGGLELGPRITVPLTLVQIAAVIGVPFALQATGRIDTLGFPAFGLAAGWLVALIATSTAARGVGSEQRQFAQSALGKYLPRDVAQLILRDPSQLALRGDRRAIYALFTDIEGFTSMCQSLEPEIVADLLNNYLETMSQTILAHGGTIDKFVGDAVVAFWGAPLARPDDAERALAAVLAMAEAGRKLALPVEGQPQMGRTRIGLHWGQAIVGNFGGEGRIQYTALGDSMNLAARLEGANKQLFTAVLVSHDAAERAGLQHFRPMGRVRVRGRSRPLEIYEPMPAEAQLASHELGQLYGRFDGGDLTALTAIEALAAATPEDLALTGLSRRLSRIGPGGTYDLN